MPEERPRNLGSDPKQFVVGRALSQSAHSELDDMVALPRLLLRLVTLPIWLPYRGWKYIQRRRQMGGSLEPPFLLENLKD